MIAVNKTATDKDYHGKVNDAYKYKVHREGPLSAPGPIQCGVFLQTKYVTRTVLQYAHSEFYFSGY